MTKAKTNENSTEPASQVGRPVSKQRKYIVLGWNKKESYKGSPLSLAYWFMDKNNRVIKKGILTIHSALLPTVFSSLESASRAIKRSEKYRDLNGISDYSIVKYEIKQLNWSPTTK